MRTCSIEGCYKTPKGRGWCGMHYQRWRKTGDPLKVLKLEPNRGLFIVECEVNGCTEKPHAKRLCDKHYKYKQRKECPEYAVWQEMKRRCYTPTFEQFADYGGRGIKVCPEWKDNFDQFFQDMSQRPTPKHQLDRIDNNGDYEPGNCRWATQAKQANNKRNNVLLTYLGKTQTFTEWSQELNLPRYLIRSRYYRGESIDRIFERST